MEGRSKEGNNNLVRTPENAPQERLQTVLQKVASVLWLLTPSTHRAAAGHTLFLSLHSLEFSMPDQFR